MPRISVIICTRNRAESLRATLETIGKLSVPEGWTVELLVVDNGSSDHTADVVRRASIPLMPVKHILEPRVGKSHAYNTGISTATGDVLLFADDDVRVPANWIEGMCRPMLHGGADAVAGGVVFPRHIDRQLQMSPLKERLGWVASTHELTRVVRVEWLVRTWPSTAVCSTRFRGLILNWGRAQKDWGISRTQCFRGNCWRPDTNLWARWTWRLNIILILRALPGRT